MYKETDTHQVILAGVGWHSTVHCSLADAPAFTTAPFRNSTKLGIDISAHDLQLSLVNSYADKSLRLDEITDAQSASISWPSIFLNLKSCIRKQWNNAQQHYAKLLIRLADANRFIY